MHGIGAMPLKFLHVHSYSHSQYTLSLGNCKEGYTVYIACIGFPNLKVQTSCYNCCFDLNNFIRSATMHNIS